jgi:hypothetical protein
LHGVLATGSHCIIDPMLMQDYRTYILNVSTTSKKSMNDASRQLSSALLDLGKSIIREFSNMIYLG